MNKQSLEVLPTRRAQRSRISSIIRFLPALFLTLLTLSAQANAVVCRLPKIAGFDRAYVKALKHVKPNTTSISRTTVYVTVENNNLYVHSNYITRGFDHPTKIATDRVDLTMSDLVLNLIGSPETSGVSELQIFRALSEITFFVDQRLFLDPRYKVLDLSDARKVSVVGMDGVPRPSKELSFPNGRTERFVQYDRSLLVRVTEPDSARVVGRFASQAFRKENVRLLSLVSDRATNQRIEQMIPETNRLSFDLSSMEVLESVMANHRGDTLIALGHVEKDSFVVLDSANKVLLTVPLSRLEGLAKQYDISLYALGCNSATDARTGVAGVFNTVEAVESISAALQSSRTHLQFVNRLASPDLPLVVDDAIFERAARGLQAHAAAGQNRARLRITVYESSTTMRNVMGSSTPLGSITVSVAQPNTKRRASAPKR